MGKNDDGTTLEFFQAMILRSSLRDLPEQIREEKQLQRKLKSQGIHLVPLPQHIIKTSQILKSCMKAFPLIA